MLKADSRIYYTVYPSRTVSAANHPGGETSTTGGRNVPRAKCQSVETSINL